MSRRKWTEEEDNYIRENVRKMSVIKIADKLDRKSWNIYRRIKELGIGMTRTVWTKEMNEKLLSMLSENKYNIAEIAREFGKSEHNVYAHIQYITDMRPVWKKRGRPRKEQKGGRKR